MLPRVISFLKSVRVTRMLALACLLLSTVEAIEQHQETVWVHGLAHHIVAEVGATGRRAQVLALRDHIRENVTWRGAPKGDDDRPFLRATARETLQSGLGFCGEDTRAFINLADALGIPAQRINLYGARPHVVAEADLGADGGKVIVDAQSPSQIEDLERLDQAMISHGYDDYSTLNLRRLHVDWLFSRTKLTMGPITYWGENPHAMKSALWFLVAIAIVVPGRLRALLRAFLLRRGWVHVSSLRVAERSGEIKDAA